MKTREIKGAASTRDAAALSQGAQHFVILDEPHGLTAGDGQGGGEIAQVGEDFIQSLYIHAGALFHGRQSGRVAVQLLGQFGAQFRAPRDFTEFAQAAAMTGKWAKAA